jgi:signal transduction histidine kinase/ActR/RegA family two-component response regulator
MVAGTRGPDGLVGKPLLEALPEFRVQGFDDLLRTVLTTGQAQVGKEALLKLDRGHDGTVEDTYWTFTYAPLRSSEGTIDRVMVFCNEVTEQVTARRAVEAAHASLRDSEERFRTIFETAAVSIWEEDFSAVRAAIDELKAQGITDFRRYFGEHPEFVQRAMSLVRVLDVNEATIKMFEAADKADLLGSLPKIFIEESLHVFVRELVALAEGRAYFEAEAQLQTVRGHSLDVFFTMALPDVPAKLDRVLFSVFDLTERKRMEQELSKSNKLESLGVLAGGIAHDFNNLLTAIVGNLYLCKASIDPGHKLYARLVEAEKACFRAQNLTKQMLTFARGGKPVIKTCALGGLLNEWVTFALRGSNVEAQFAVQPDLWPVEADEGQLSQVLHNLVINAQQAMTGGGVVRVTAHNLLLETESALRLPGGRYVQISVVDQGAGIPKEHLSKIFDPFFTTKAKGSGLGLTTSYAIVAKHRGLLTVESEPGRGATFFVYLPASAEAVTPQHDDVTLSVKGKGSILFMDDEDAIRRFMGDLLGEMGYQVECVSDGATAVNRYRRALHSGKRFDIVILDLTVPGGMGGQEAIHQLLALDPAVRAIVSSGYSNDPVIAEFRQYGFRGRLSKPYHIEDLAKVLSTLR